MTMRWDSNSADAAELREKFRSGELAWSIKPSQILNTVFPHWQGRYTNIQIRNAVLAIKKQIIAERNAANSGAAPQTPMPNVSRGYNSNVARMPPQVPRKKRCVDDGKIVIKYLFC